MSTLGWVLLGISIAGCMWGARWIARDALSDYPVASDDWETVVWAMSVALTMCWTWPAVAAYVAFRATIGQTDASKFAARISRTHSISSVRWSQDELARVERELGIPTDDNRTT